jgi:hypothetical protein
LRTLVPDPGAGRLVGANVAVTPLGNPVAVNETLALKPPPTVTFRFVLVFEPAVTVIVLEANVAWNTGTAVASLQ